MRILGLIVLTALLGTDGTAAERKGAPTSRGAPEGITLLDADRNALESGAAELGGQIEKLRGLSDPHLRSLLPDATRGCP